MAKSGKFHAASPTRRRFIQTSLAAATSATASGAARATPSSAEALSDPESWLTKPDDFDDVSRGKPIPHTLSEEKRREVGLTRDTWRLNVISDPEFPAMIRQPLADEQA